MDLKLDKLVTSTLFSEILKWKIGIKGFVHITLEKFQSENFTLKRIKCFLSMPRRKYLKTRTPFLL